MSDALPPINTNDLRDYADRIENPYRQFVLDAASELDATRTERNLLRQALTATEARVGANNALAGRLEAHVEEMANQCHGLTMQEWNTISNDILLAADALKQAGTVNYDKGLALLDEYNRCYAILLGERKGSDRANAAAWRTHDARRDLERFLLVHAEALLNERK